MIHTDTKYSQPTVFKLTTSLHDKYITLDTHGRIDEMISDTGKLGNTFMKAVSYVSNNAASYEDFDDVLLDLTTWSTHQSRLSND